MRLLKWTAGLVLATLLLIVVLIAIFGWNWLRAPIERATLDKTGRELVIAGDLKVNFGWPQTRLQADGVSFSNPDWATEKQMVTADAVKVTVDLGQLIRRRVVFPEVMLVRPVVFLEQGPGGRRNWLMDINQQDEGARLRIDRLRLDQGTLGYDDVRQKTRIRSEFSTSATLPVDAGIVFKAAGIYRGLPLKAHGNGGPVLGLRDEATPYPLRLELIVGDTGIKLDGTITSLLKFTAMDTRLALRGKSLAQLYPLLGMTFPVTRPYAMDGHLVHTGSHWRYEKFSGRIGGSDVAGSVSVETGGKRLSMKANLVSKVLDFDDLGSLIGSRPGSVAKAANSLKERPKEAEQGRQGRVLPDLPFNAASWNSVDAELDLRAKAIRHAKQLALEDLVTHLSLRDSVLTLDPLNFGVAGGQLNAAVSLDGRADPIQASARVRALNIHLERFFPKAELSNTGMGRVNGEFSLNGRGNSVGKMLATSNGKVGLVVSGGEISKLMMEQVGLHLWEMLALKVSGDRPVKLHCAVANFGVKEGVMTADALVLDTQVTTILGTGNVNLGKETLDLTFNQRTKATSPLALRSPIYVRGNLARPVVSIDKGRVAVRAAGAIALAVINPLLVLMPLVDAGPGKDSDCGQLIRDARAFALREK